MDSGVRYYYYRELQPRGWSERGIHRAAAPAEEERSNAVTRRAIYPKCQRYEVLGSDEQKPHCQRCQRAHVVCEGYAKDFKWINEGMPLQSVSVIQRLLMLFHSQGGVYLVAQSSPQAPQASHQNEAQTNHLEGMLHSSYSTLAIESNGASLLSIT